MNNDPRYAQVDAAAPSEFPPLTKAVAYKYAKKLVRHFGRKHLGSPNQIGHARLGSWASNRTCWASTKPTRDHYKGWGRMIHDVSHVVFRQRHPSFRPHDGGHATLEREMMEYAVAKGWIKAPCSTTST